MAEAFWKWCGRHYEDPRHLPKSPIAEAPDYVLNRRAQLEVWLSDPDVPIDTNHLERGLRVLPLGRKNWLFCWTEVGAEAVGTVQSPVATCRLQGVDPRACPEDAPGESRSIPRAASRSPRREDGRIFSPAIRRPRTSEPESRAAPPNCRAQAESSEIRQSPYVVVCPLTADKRTPDGMPVHSFTTLLADIGTLTLNHASLPGRPDSRFLPAAEPAEIQRKAFELLGLDAGRDTCISVPG